MTLSILRRTRCDASSVRGMVPGSTVVLKLSARKEILSAPVRHVMVRQAKDHSLGVLSLVVAEAVVLGLAVGLGVEGGLVGGSCHGGLKLQSEGVGEGRKVEWRKGLLRSRVLGELPWKVGEAGWRVVGGLVDGVERE